MGKKFLQIAWRNLLKYKITALIGILGLSIRIRACLTIYLIVSYELSFDGFHPDKNRIYRVYLDDDGNYPNGKQYHTSIRYDAVTEIRDKFTGIETITCFYMYHCKVIVPAGNNQAKNFEVPETQEIIVTEPQYFQIFKYKWLAGNESTALDQPGKVVLTESKARKYFGLIPLEDMIGKELIYYDTIPLLVSGIVKDIDGNTDLIFKDFVSIGTIKNRYVMPFDNGQTFLKLTKGATPAQFEAQTASMVKMTRSHMNGSRSRKIGRSEYPGESSPDAGPITDHLYWRSEIHS